MPTTYNVSMGQAVSVKDLGEDSLVTGITSIDNQYDASRALMSCSAVALVNTRTGAAGLFHFPSGDIEDIGDAEVRRSRDTLQDMVADIRPNQVHFGHGRGIGAAAAGYTMFGGDDDLPRQNAQLRRYVHSLVPDGQMNEAVHTATAGAFLISRGGQGGNPFEVDLYPEHSDLGRVVDLSEARAGDHRGFRMYGRTVSEQAAEDRRTERRFEELRRSGANTPDSYVPSETTRSGASSPASRAQSGAIRSGTSSPAARAQPEAPRSGAGSPAPREQFEVADPIPNVPPRHRRRWLQRAIRRMTCRGG